MTIFLMKTAESPVIHLLRSSIVIMHTRPNRKSALFFYPWLALKDDPSKEPTEESLAHQGGKKKKEAETVKQG